jgi:DNA polymerase-1
VSLVLLFDDAARPGNVVLQEATDDGEPGRRESVPADRAAQSVWEKERALSPRWVWDDTARRYPPLLAAGVRVARAHDLRLCHAILRHSTYAAGSALATAPAGPWDAPRVVPVHEEAAPATLFDDDVDVVEGSPDAPLDVLAELRSQLDAVAGSSHPARLRLLLAAESTGALTAAEMSFDGMPWSAEAHDRILTEILGERPPGGGVPSNMERLTRELRAALGQPHLNLDSISELLNGLRRAGIEVSSTRARELRQHGGPIVEQLLEYKSLARLYTANGWAWLEAWVSGGRFRPEYVPGGVITGRWASSGGGALQIPAAVRGAAVADPGWTLVVADAAQVEPRVLAAMSGDQGMARAGRHADLYQGFVDAGVVSERKQAKVAMLGALYGATTGDSAALMPRLERAFPQAVAMVEAAARAGERGEVVTTWLGRSSIPPPEWWHEVVSAAAVEGAGPEEARRARSARRDWGRFTRNFIVQGTAAEWALCWMAATRRRLRELAGGPHLVFFLHDELVVHAPEEVAEDAARALRESAAEAGRLLFGTTPVDFALDVSIVRTYADAKN